MNAALRFLFSGTFQKFSLGAAVVAALATSGGMAASPQEKTTSPETMARFFSATCAMTVPDLGKIDEVARLKKWRPLNDQQATIMRPSDSTAEFKGWWAEMDGDVFVIGTSRGTINGQSTYTCTVSAPRINTEKLIQILQTQFRMKRINDHVEAFQRWQDWNVDIYGTPILFSLTSEHPTNPKGAATLSATSRASKAR